jgi:hypothetical protein
VAFDLLLFAFRYFNAIFSLHVSFLFLFLLVLVLLIESKGPRCSDGEFDSYAIYAHVTLLWEGACISFISVDDRGDWFGLIVRFMQLRDCLTKGLC